MSAWTCPSCGTGWPEKPFVDGTIGCPECGSIAATSEADAGEVKYTQADLDFFADNTDEYFDKWRAAEARAEAAAKSLRECIPYVNRALNPNDPDNAPWRIETATGVMERLRAALAGDETEVTA